MKEQTEERAASIADYIIDSNITVLIYLPAEAGGWGFVFHHCICRNFFMQIQ